MVRVGDLFLLIVVGLMLTPKSMAKSEETGAGTEEAEAIETEVPVEVKSPPKENEESLSGTVKIMRKIGQTEVFFVDLKESYFIPPGSKNYSVFKAFEDSQKKGTKVSFRANKKTRQVIEMEAPKSEPPKSTVKDAAAKGGAK